MIQFYSFLKKETFIMKKKNADILEYNYKASWSSLELDRIKSTRMRIPSINIGNRKQEQVRNYWGK